MSDVMPSFNFQNPGLTEEEFQEAEAKASEWSSKKSFRPGNYSLRIVEAKFNRYSEADPTWFSVALVLSQSGTKVTRNVETGKIVEVTNDQGEAEPYALHWVMVPTAKVTYNEGNSKRPTFLFAKFKEFMAAIGEEVLSTKESLSATIPKYFSDPSVLAGKVVDVDLGYDGYHIEFIAKDEYRILDRNGEEFKGSDGETLRFKSFQEAEAEAAEYKLEIQRGVRPLKFHPAKLDEVAVDADEDW